MSSVNKTSNATKVFTWSSVASGKKQTQAEVERNKECEKKEQREEENLQKRVSSLKRGKDVQGQNAARIAQQEKEMKDYFTKENGYWEKEVQKRYEKYICPVTGFERSRMLEVPHNVNERSMKYIERMLVNYPEVTSTCKNVGDFKKVFKEAYVPYAIRQFGEKNVIDASSKFARWNSNSSNETLVEQFDNLQGWVAYEEGIYKSREADLKKKGYGIHPTPPWIDKFWVFVKNVSFESCLWAMNERSKTFEMETKTGDDFNTGFVKIASSTLPDSSELTWLTDLSTYRGWPHSAKEECRQKKEARSRIMDEDYGCYSD